MRFFEFAFIVTNECNFSCSYCRQKHDKQVLSTHTIKKAIDFFYSFIAPFSHIVFYGGEPLLAFDRIQYTVEQFSAKNTTTQKKQRFSITTNGSLLTPEKLHFFDSHHFYIVLSFDHLSQDQERCAYTAEPIRQLLQELQSPAYPHLSYTTNSVFTPSTVSQLAQSLQQIVHMNVPNITFELDRSVRWDETALAILDTQLQQLSDFLCLFYQEKETIPILNFRPKDTTPRLNKIAYCNGGMERLAITPAEFLWGCVQFHDYFQVHPQDSDFQYYSFGSLDYFIDHFQTVYPQIIKNYALLRMDNYFTAQQSCYLCPELQNCSVCPVTLAQATHLIGKLPPWYCQIAQIRRKHRNQFLQAIHYLKQP